jgi:hypothetical protein
VLYNSKCPCGSANRPVLSSLNRTALGLWLAASNHLALCLVARTLSSHLHRSGQIHRVTGSARPPARVLLWAEQETKLKLLHPKAKNLLEALLYRGEVPRGKALQVIGTSASGSRRIVSDLAKYEAIRSPSPYGPLRLALLATLAPRWLPGLFPDKKDEG